MWFVRAAWELVRPAWLAHPTPYQANTEVERQWCHKPGETAERAGLSDEPAPWVKDDAHRAVRRLLGTDL